MSTDSVYISPRLHEDPSERALRVKTALEHIGHETAFAERAADVHDANRLQAIHDKKIKTRRRVAGLVAGALVVAVAVGGYMAFGREKASGLKQTPIIHNSFLEALPKQFPNVLSVRPDAEHPGLEEVTYRFSPGHASLSHAYLTVDPKMKQGFEDAIGNLETYNGGNRIVRYGGVLTFLVDTRSKPGAGIIVANPDQASGVQN